jgi:hypothetical protein
MLHLLCALALSAEEAAPLPVPTEEAATQPARLAPAPATEVDNETVPDSFSLGPFDIAGRGFIQNDFRMVLVKNPGNGEQAGQYIRNETQIMGRLVITAGEHVKAVAQARPLYTGVAKVQKFDDLLDRTRIDPFWFELDDAFVEFTNIFDGFDLKIGRQTVVWGTGDFFNPTNNINARDFYDPLLFGRPMGNQMVLARYQTPIDLNFTAMYIPVFRPARLPTTANAAFAGGATVASSRDQRAIQDLNDFQASLMGFGSVNNTLNLNPIVPGTFADNAMAAFKMAGTLKTVDFSLSYLYGRWDLPTPQSATAVATINVPPGATLPDRTDVTTTVNLVYPRMHVIGADMSTSIEALGGLGVWAEAAVFFPQRVDFTIQTPAVVQSLYPTALPCSETAPCPVVRSTPFVKATVGFDYTFFKRVYLNAQYLYGFVDEFGADFLKHYAVANVDIKPFGDAYTLRLAGVVNMNDASVVAFPALILKPYAGVEIYLGGLIFAGTPKQKFGRPENGSTQAFFRTRFSF